MSRLKSVLKYGFISMAALMGLAIGVVCFFPGPILRSTAAVLAKKTGLRFNPGDVSGNLITGIKFHHLDLALPQAHLHIDTLKIHFKWLKLLRKTIDFDAIDVQTPQVIVHPALASKPNRKKSSAASSWRLAADRIRVSDGVVEIDKE